MPVAAILSGTPVWVWALFAYLLFRGITALRAREMTPARMLVLPVIFLVWALAGMFFELAAWPVALAAFVVGARHRTGRGLGQRGTPSGRPRATR